MIISASYRTDIPAFYGAWFMNRLDAGGCLVENPYSGQPYRVSLRREDVDGFVFWTKNIGPFLDKLKVIHQRRYPFMVQYTITGYPRALESSVVDARRASEHMRFLSDTYGNRAAVWRYDTILFTSLTPHDFHRRSFDALAKALEGTTDEVVVSFAQIYKKTLRSINRASATFNFTWDDPADDQKLALLSELSQMATARGMQLTMCSQKQYSAEGTQEAHCIDAKRLSDIAGREIRAAIKGNRPDCGCFLSRDIGAYDTCPHGCVYCYAVQNRELAHTRYHEHDSSSEYLFVTKPDMGLSTTEKSDVADIPKQLKLI